MLFALFIFFFFSRRRRHTRSKRDWSSDVCSSDLLSIPLSILAIILVSSFFITSADSATFVLGMQTSNGSLYPAARTKIVWGVALSSIAYVLLLSGGETGLEALQSAAIIAALPFSFVIILMMI